MRTHLLSELDVAGLELVVAIEPQLDLYRAQRVLGIQIDMAEAVRFLLTLAYETSAKRYELQLCFDGVRQLSLPEMTPLMFLSELEIEDVRQSQLEGIRFVATAEFVNFRCACASIGVVGFREVMDRE